MTRAAWEDRSRTLLNLACSRRGPALAAIAQELARHQKKAPRPNPIKAPQPTTVQETA